MEAQYSFRGHCVVGASWALKGVRAAGGVQLAGSGGVQRLLGFHFHNDAYDYPTTIQPLDMDMLLATLGVSSDLSENTRL